MQRFEQPGLRTALTSKQCDPELHSSHWGILSLGWSRSPENSLRNENHPDTTDSADINSCQWGMRADKQQGIYLKRGVETLWWTLGVTFLKCKYDCVSCAWGLSVALHCQLVKVQIRLYRLQGSCWPSPRIRFWPCLSSSSMPLLVLYCCTTWAM